MGEIASAEILAFLQNLGERYPHSGTILLLGASGLALLGNPRPTVDIDYVLESPPELSAELQNTIATVAAEMKLELEAVHIGEFIPLPENASKRHRLIGQFGKLTVYVYDPYSIALSKVARGFETDLQDVIFLLRQEMITFKQLEAYVQAALPRATEFDINPNEFRQHLQAIRRMMR